MGWWSRTTKAISYPLFFIPFIFTDELTVRTALGITAYDLSVVLVVDEIPDKKIEILCKSKTYSDVKEVLIEL